MAAKPEIAAPDLARRERGDAYYWRFTVSALSFALFGLGALLVSAWLSLLRLVPLPQSAQRRHARAIIHRGMRVFVGFMTGLGGLTYEVHGRERLGRPGQLIIANHPSLIDVVFLLALTPNVSCVFKHAMRVNPLTRAVVKSAGYIANEPTAEMVESAAQALDSHETVIMFPEGTRTRPDQPLAFHRGAANIAVRAARILTPVYIRCEPRILTKFEPWYRVSSRRVHFRIEVGEDFNLAAFRGTAPIPVASRALNERLRAQFQRELQHTDEIY